MTEATIQTREEDLRLLIEHAASSFSVRMRAGQELPREICEILDYIHEHLSDEMLSVKTIRRSCRIGNHNISSRFLLAVGVGIGDYIKDLRMEVAAYLLRRPDLPIYRIGSFLGFSHQESFTRTFRRHFGSSPSAYRNGLLSGNGNGGKGGS